MHALARPWTVLAAAPISIRRGSAGRSTTNVSTSRESRPARHSEGPAGWRLGATTTWSELIEADLPPLFDGLKQAAREVGGRQIQNVGTLAGNLCNASPAADGVPPLLALDARGRARGPRRHAGACRSRPSSPATGAPCCHR
jgi:hypothetical protein